MDREGSPLHPATVRPGTPRQCAFCMEEIRPGATVCPHCGSNLAPLQNLADQYAALEQRFTALEQEIAGLRAGNSGTELGALSPEPPSADPAQLSSTQIIKWPHMADNIFLGLAALLAAHWLATTLPGTNRTIFRLVALVVAGPFGFRFERHSRSSATGQVLAALAFGSVGTLAIGVMDLAIAGHAPVSLTAQDLVSSVAVISLSHYAGSSLAHAMLSRADRAATNTAAERRVAASSGMSFPPVHLETAGIKSTADAIKALYDALAPLAASAAALWAALAHTLS